MFAKYLLEFSGSQRLMESQFIEQVTNAISNTLSEYTRKGFAVPDDLIEESMYFEYTLPLVCKNIEHYISYIKHGLRKSKRDKKKRVFFFGFVMHDMALFDRKVNFYIPKIITKTSVDGKTYEVSSQFSLVTKFKSNPYEMFSKTFGIDCIRTLFDYDNFIKNVDIGKAFMTQVVNECLSQIDKETIKIIYKKGNQ